MTSILTKKYGNLKDCSSMSVKEIDTAYEVVIQEQQKLLNKTNKSDRDQTIILKNAQALKLFRTARPEAVLREQQEDNRKNNTAIYLERARLKKKYLELFKEFKELGKSYRTFKNEKDHHFNDRWQSKYEEIFDLEVELGICILTDRIIQHKYLSIKEYCNLCWEDYEADFDDCMAEGKNLLEVIRTTTLEQIKEMLG